MWSILQCALLGNFYESRERLPYAQRFHLITELTDINAVDYFKSLPDDEHFTFFAFREYLQVIANNIPALKSLIDATAPLNQQTERISDALRLMRQNASGDWRVGFTPTTLEMLKRVYKRAPKRKMIPRGCIDVSGSLTTMTQRSVQRRALKRDHGVAFDVDLFQATHKRACRWTTLEQLAEVTDVLASVPSGSVAVTEINQSARAVLRALELSPYKKPTSFFDEAALGNDALRSFSDIAVALDAAMSTVVIQLPQSFLQLQVAAVARRFDCSNNEWGTATQIKACACCHEVKNFVLHEDERGDTQRNTRSAGFKKLSLDVDSGRLSCALTPSCSKYDLTTHDVISQAPDGALSGGIVVTRQGAYTISPCCGFLCLTASVKANPSGYDCPACCQLKHNELTHAPDLRLCGFCNKRLQAKISAENVVMLRSATGSVLKYSFCKAHFRTWARTRNGYLTFEFLSENMTNRNGSGLITNPL